MKLLSTSVVVFGMLKLLGLRVQLFTLNVDVVGLLVFEIPLQLSPVTRCGRWDVFELHVPLDRTYLAKVKSFRASRRVPLRLSEYNVILLFPSRSTFGIMT